MFSLRDNREAGFGCFGWQHCANLTLFTFSCASANLQITFRCSLSKKIVKNLLVELKVAESKQRLNLMNACYMTALPRLRKDPMALNMLICLT